mgnify:FL=1
MTDNTNPDINLDNDTELDIDDDFCAECDGEGVLEDCNRNGPFEVPCPYCSEIGI